MNILFIGGTGNISTACVERALAQGHSVSIVTRGNRPVTAGCEAIIANRFDRAAFAKAVDGKDLDVVINFLGFDYPELKTDFSIFAGRIKQYLFISSATVYAKPHQFLPITEDHPLGNPFSEYAQKKQACEEWLLEKQGEDFPVTIVRPSHTWSEKWLPNVVKSAGYTLGARLRSGKPVFVPDDGSSLWTLTTSADFATGLIGLAGRPESLGETFHLTSDEALPWKTIYQTAAKALGVSNPDIVEIPVDFICDVHPPLVAGLKGDKRENTVFDNGKIKALVPNFTCPTSFETAIADAVAWFDADDSRKVVDPVNDAVFDAVIGAWRKRRH